MAKKQAILINFSLILTLFGTCFSSAPVTDRVKTLPQTAAPVAKPAPKVPGPQAGVQIPGVAGVRTPFPKPSQQGFKPVQDAPAQAAVKKANLPKVTAAPFEQRKRKLTPEQIEKQKKAEEELKKFFKQLEEQVKKLEQEQAKEAKNEPAKKDASEKTEENKDNKDNNK